MSQSTNAGKVPAGILKGASESSYFISSGFISQEIWIRAPILAKPSVWVYPLSESDVGPRVGKQDEPLGCEKEI